MVQLLIQQQWNVSVLLLNSGTKPPINAYAKVHKDNPASLRNGHALTVLSNLSKLKIQQTRPNANALNLDKFGIKLQENVNALTPHTFNHQKVKALHVVHAQMLVKPLPARLNAHALLAKNSDWTDVFVLVSTKNKLNLAVDFSAKLAQILQPLTLLIQLNATVQLANLWNLLVDNKNVLAQILDKSTKAVYVFMTAQQINYGILPKENVCANLDSSQNRAIQMNASQLESYH